jgi:hypothetical protein
MWKVWVIINILLAVTGTGSAVRGWILGQKSEAYVAFGWLLLGAVLLVISFLSAGAEYFWG